MKACKQMSHGALGAKVVAGALLFAALGALAETAPTAPIQIYQQRTADGRIVLTDRPEGGMKIERAWRIDNEEAAARQRAAQMQREAQAVSERAQRILERQRLALAGSGMGPASAGRFGADSASEPVVDEGVFYAPFFGNAGLRHSRFDGRFDGRSNAHEPRPKRHPPFFRPPFRPLATTPGGR
jgi:hypothetical protein